jgi:glycine/D-amino acid oxidase-like deaminating enzyme
MYAASLESITAVEHIIREEKIDCNFDRCGHLEVACKQSHFDGYARSAGFIQENFNHELKIVPRDLLSEEVGSSIYFGGMVDETSAGLNPARYVAGLAQAAMQAGASIHEHSRVLSQASVAQNGKRGFSIVSARGNLFAKDLLVATSGYTSAATPALRRKIIPIGSFIIATEPLPNALAHELSPRNRMIYDSRHYLHYYRLTPDNRMLFGGRAAFFPETKDTIRRSAAILRDGMIKVFPQLKDSATDYAWGGTLDFCFDTMPHCGQINGLHFALGYAGHGVAMATYLGMKMADQIAGSAEKIPFSAIPFPGAPLHLYREKPWFLPFAGAYYKILDWIS